MARISESGTTARARAPRITRAMMLPVPPCSGVTPVRRYVNSSSCVHGTGDGLAPVSAGAPAGNTRTGESAILPMLAKALGRSQDKIVMRSYLVRME